MTTRSQKRLDKKGGAPTKILTSLEECQKEPTNFIRSNELSIFLGDPGTGKDFIQLHYAIRGLLNREFDHLIISKPVVESGPSVGFLPGELSEKIAPFQRSFIDMIVKIVGKEAAGNILAKTSFENVGFIRGNTFPDNSAVILSECQNLSLHQLMSFTTRATESCKMMFNGDSYQTDIRDSGLQDFLRIIENIESYEVYYMKPEHQMRHPKFVQLMEEYKKLLNEKGKVYGNKK